MTQWLRTRGGWWLAWVVLTAAGAVWFARAELTRLQQDFETDARIAHRLMSQQVVQYDAVLATLALLEPNAGADYPERRLPSVYSSILRVQRRAADEPWPDAEHADALAAAEARSRAGRRADLAVLDLAHGRYQLVIGSEPLSYALEIDLVGSVPWRDWPMNPQRSPVRLVLQRDGQQLVLQHGQAAEHGWRYSLSKELASPSQPFELVAERQVGWAELPWRTIGGWAVAMALLLAGLWAAQRQRIARRRAEELLRLGQVARLNALGELSAGLAHELNQPLTAVLANAQAARRLLDDDPPDLATARDAMGQAVEQARRASGVVGRLRRVIERPEAGGDMKPLVLQEVVRSAMHLLAPEFARHGVAAQFDASAQAPVRVQAEAVALEQIVHNLLMNAMQALDLVPAAERRLVVSVGRNGEEGVLTVTDNGRGIAPEALPRLFEPFFSTREGGLGLGLSLSETLASGMGGSLSAANASPRGARFTLLLPLVAPST
ncbi:signal transduction histidine kinase [Variovorax boronicumulans]|uniref:histidine kinase n=1 Tax=Variovorax boronicumulans TaxID=436515 RepID=A0AAW8E4Y4_9BURK|nr:ATP-binding protein [Variovorax boronicumulans]MDP9881327.1 signal transduction histidine kinase [Variovorax boronicumulans]MDP9926614.1 signal transduction histidine kinase [Variovorax boronicumulans]